MPGSAQRSPPAARSVATGWASLTLDAERRAPREAPCRMSTPAAACHSGSVGKILVVDDEQSMREFLGICLRRAGHEVMVAQTGAEALDHLRASPIDIVVSDLRMPGGLDGLGLLQAIKSGTIKRVAVAGTPPAPIDPDVILVT